MQTDRMMSSTAPSVPAIAQHGFTLIELAIVMFIVSLLIGGMLLPLSAQQDVRSNAETQKILADARDALLGFAIATGRLPCPASPVANSGLESPVGGGVCTNPHDGLFPAATLGFNPVDAQGYAYDGWSNSTASRLRYAVTTTALTYDFTTAPTTTTGMKGKGMSNLLPDLHICNSGAIVQNPGTAAADCTAAANALATDAVAVIYSLGKNAGTGGTSVDELPNVTADRVFVSTQPSPSFDDSLVWLSRTTLFNRMVAAGTLP